MQEWEVLLIFYVCFMSSVDRIFGNRTIIRPELQSIIQNITEHNLEDEASTQTVIWIIVAFILSIGMGFAFVIIVYSIDLLFISGFHGFQLYLFS